jgi:MFS family permease
VHPEPAAPAESPRLPRTVLVLGVVSLLTDLSSEMIFPLLPAFLALRLPGAAPLLLGLMEGLAELVASVLKYQSGRWADRSRRLKPLVLAGYSVSGLARPLMAFITAPWQPVLIRALDRVGKGVRSSPRDALIAHAVAPGLRGRAFGFHRGMDHAGAALGALLAMGLLALGLRVESVFLLSAVPGALGVLAILLAAEAPHAPAPSTAAPQAPLPRRLGWYLGPVLLFGLANATDGFLLLKLSAEGAAPTLLPLAWLLLHVVKAAVSYPAGHLADRLGPARLVVAGWLLYALSYLALAAVHGVAATLAVMALYGLYHALAEGAEKALLVSLVPPEARGRAFGLYNALGGFAALGAGLLFGGLWTRAGSSVAFAAAAGVAAVAAVALALLLPRARPPEPAGA